MATAQQWRNVALIVAVTLAVLCIGSADAWGCPDGYKGCDKYKHGCETCIKNDPNNCGDCGKKCKELPYTTVKCEDGKCVYNCKPGWADCDHDLWKNGCETNIYNDIYNCGSCGHKCPCYLKDGEPTCSNGKCGEKCKWGTKYDKDKKCCVPGY